MKSTMKLVLALAAVVVIVACTQVFAADEPTAPPPPPPARERIAAPPAMGGGAQGARAMRGAPAIWPFVQRLELTEDQQVKVDDLRKAAMEKTQAISQTVNAAQAKLNDLALTGASEADIRAAATEVGKAMGDQAMVQASAAKEVKALLTDEQKAKLDEMIKDNQAQMAARRNAMRDRQQEGRREVRERARENAPVAPAQPN
jgi:Spy/CpxP family protein refolding chaperone